MRAIVVDHWMGPEELTLSEAPEPVLRPGSLAVEVKAAGCNFFDILMCQGRYQVKPPLPFVPGAELAGVVTAVGEGVQGFEVGQRVFASCGMGGFAERAVVPAAGAWPLPEGMSFQEGAALPVIYPTSYVALVDRAALQPGETLLVHAGAGGVGSAAVQIGKALGARVLATAGGAEKCQVARQAGADVAIDYRAEDFVECVKQETGGAGADVIYDPVGGEIFERSLKCIAWSGRLLVIGFAGGSIPSVKTNRILLKNIAVVGLQWGAYAQRQPGRIPEVFHALFELFAAGQIRPLIFRTWPLSAASEALHSLASRQTWGKLILTPEPEPGRS